MKALLVFSFMIIAVPLALFAPFWGMLAYIWVAYLRPHEWAYMPGARFSLWVAVATLIGYVLFEMTKHWPKLLPNLLLLLLWFQLLLSTVFAETPETAQPKLVEFTKTILMAVLMTTMVDTEKRARILLLGTVLAIGLLSLRSAISILLLGGENRAYGPGGMFEDNNDYALLLVTVIPMLFFCGRGEKGKLLRYGCYFFAATSFFTVFFTRSRGGFVGLCLALVVIGLKSKYKVTGLVGGALALWLMFSIVPAGVIDRLNTIQTARESDTSAQQRLRAWGVSLAIIADHPLTGVGARNLLDVYRRYGPAEEARMAHNAYLQIGVDAGIPALVLFVLMILYSYWRLWAARSMLQARAPASPLINYTHGMQAGLAGYAAAAFFASRHDLELIYEIAALAASFVLIARRYQREAETRAVVEAGRTRPAAALEPTFAQ